MPVPSDYRDPLNSMCTAGGRLDRRESVDVTVVEFLVSKNFFRKYESLEYYKVLGLNKQTIQCKGLR